MRRVARVDDNQADIVDLFRRAGAQVQSLAVLGGGVPDLLVGFNGELALVEVKNGALSPSRRKLTPDEEAWHKRWHGYPVHIVATDADVMHVLATMRLPDWLDGD